MPDLQVGDRIKCVVPNNGIKMDDTVYTVVKLFDPNEWVRRPGVKIKWVAVDGEEYQILGNYPQSIFIRVE
jgi:hypothetical protein